MPSNPYIATLTGLSSTTGYITYFPDVMQGRPFNLTASVTASSSATFYSLQHSMDYPGQNSSAFTSGGWISTAATWTNSSGIAGTAIGAATAVLTSYSYPVTAIRLYSSAGSSQAIATLTIVQAG